MKKIFLFAVLCSIILLLMPMVSSVETRLIDENNKEINNLFYDLKEIIIKSNIFNLNGRYIKLYIALLIFVFIEGMLYSMYDMGMSFIEALINSLLSVLIMGILFFPTFLWAFMIEKIIKYLVPLNFLPDEEYNFR